MLFATNIGPLEKTLNLRPCVFAETSSKMKKAITGKTDFSEMIVLSSWRYETIFRMVCFWGVYMMDPPQKYDFVRVIAKSVKSQFYP